MISTSLPTVSVIIPCYNQGRYLYESVSSAMLAYSGPLEIIIVDDGSTERKTSHYIREVESLSDCIRVIRQSNQGLSGARNTGIENATGDYIQFLDADDLLIPGKLDVQVAQMMVACDLDVSVCNYLLCDENRNHFYKSDESIAPFDFSLDDFLYRWERGFSIPIHCGLFRRSLFESLRFDTEVRAKEDWLMWISLVFRGARIGYLAGHYAIYRQHSASMRRSYINMGKSWLKAAIKVDAMLEGIHPLFFESSVSWFEQCYRANPTYRKEVAALQCNCKDGDAASAQNLFTDELVDVDALVAKLSTIDQSESTPLISVVVPIFNHYEYLDNCLRSLAEQGDVSIEIICVDDASTDLRVEKLMVALANRLDRLKIIRHTQNQGISLSQNEAVEQAQGEYIAFLDCDDSLQERALKRVTQEIIRNPNIDYWFSDRLDVDENDKIIRRAIYGGYDHIKFRGRQYIVDDLLDGMVASHLKVIKRTAYLKAGGCNDLFSGVQDWELALKIAEQGGRFGYIPEALYRHRIHTASVTRSDSVKQFRKTNMVRRVYASKRFRGEENVVFDRERLKELMVSGDSSLCVFNPEKRIPTLDELKSAWREKKLCVFDLRGKPSLTVINFAREFNSYFDCILWDDPSTVGSLLGYLWSNSILCRETGIRLEVRFAATSILP